MKKQVGKGREEKEGDRRSAWSRVARSPNRTQDDADVLGAAFLPSVAATDKKMAEEVLARLVWRRKMGRERGNTHLEDDRSLAYDR